MVVLEFAILGLGTGAILALLAVGILVIYRGSGVLNLAHGAYAMFGGYGYWELKQRGLPTALAIVITVGATSLTGLVTDQGVLRRLRTASPLARLIATGGVLLVLQSTVALLWGVVPKTSSAIIPSSPIHLQDVSVPSDRLVLLAIAAALTAAVALVWRYTRAGWIAEAVSEDQRLARSLGWSPERVSAITWMIGTGLAGLAGVLIAPITGLDTTTMPLLIVPVLAAALVGRFRNWGLAFAGAVLIGVAQSLTARYVNLTGAADAIPFLIIIVGLVAAGSALPLRGYAGDRLPIVGSGRRNWKIWVPLVVVAAVLVATVSSPDWQAAFAATFAVAIILLSFVVVVGYTGQLSLAQFTIAGLGALVAARLMYDAQFPFWAALLGGTIAASVLGTIVAIPALRTRGVNLAVITLGMALTVQSMVFNNQSIANAGVGTVGITLPSLSLFGWSIDPVLHPQRFTFVALVVFVLAAVVVARVRRTALGRMLLAVRDSERAAASNTISVFAGKLIGFAIGGAIAGLGGVLLAFQQSVVQVNGFDPITGLNYLSDAVIGGVGFIGGALFGASLSPNSIGAIISLHLQNFAPYIPLISGVLLLLTLMLNPHGWAAQMQKVRRARLARRGLVDNERLQWEEPLVQAAPALPRRLEVREVEVRYGGVVAVKGLDIDVKPGTVVGLIGPNGAGKTSFVDAVTGFQRASAGSVLLGGVDLTGLSAYRRARAGMARSFQTLELYPDMTVLEHILTGAEGHDLRSIARNFLGRRKAMPARVREILEMCGIEEFAGRLPEELSYGTRRLLSVARALASGASVLLIDEPVAGLDSDESMRFGEVIIKLAHEKNMSVVVIEHDMPFVMAVCDRIVVMDGGRKISEGTPSAIQADPVAIAAYLGDESAPEAAAVEAPRPTGVQTGGRRGAA